MSWGVGGHRDGIEQDIDFEAVFDATPSPCLVLTPDLLIVAVNRAYLRATKRERHDLIGTYIFDAFPENPDDPDAKGMANLKASLGRVLSTGEQDTMALQKYDIPVVTRPGCFEERYWSPINTPVLGPDGKVGLVVHRVEDVTPFVRERHGGRLTPPRPGEDLWGRSQAMEAELFARAKELQELNEELREAHAREREVALSLQQHMLPVVVPGQHPNVAVRYRPAVSALNVCGDWYELVELPGDRLAVAVGDVVGHGLPAAGVMGQLRSALSTTIRAVGEPARALGALDLYARSIEGALATTAVQVVIDRSADVITYGSAGHLPPMLLEPGRDVVLLDKATDPPLGTRPQYVPWPQANLSHRPGSTLVLYTDGLVERRGEDIDVGLSRLADSLVGRVGLPPEQLADGILTDLGVTDGGTDDIALVVVRL